jgi:hypothetical protein
MSFFMLAIIGQIIKKENFSYYLQLIDYQFFHIKNLKDIAR